MFTTSCKLGKMQTMRQSICKSLIFLAVIMLTGSCGIPSSSACAPTAIMSGNTPTQLASRSTIAPTPTIIPTLSADETRGIALDWLKNNSNCRLPCLWGLTPSVTNSQERKVHLARFGRVEALGFRSGLADYEEKGQGVRTMFFVDRGVEIAVVLSYYETNGMVEQLGLSAYATQDWEKVFGDTFYGELLHYYLPSQILSNYGPPSSVLIGAWHEDPLLKSPFTPFSTVLIYSDLGFMVEYISPSELIDGSLRGCPIQAYLNLWAWSPEEDLSLADILAKKPEDIGIVPLSIDYFKPLEQATSMTLEDFYETFRDPQTTQCLETPADLWPRP